MGTDLTKSQQLLLAIILFNGGVSSKVSLAKLQYFSDFIHYAFNSELISEPQNVYTRQGKGPLARNLTVDIKNLENMGMIVEKSYHYSTESNASKNIKLTSQEIKTIKYVLNRYGNSSWEDLVRISHEQIPYLSTTEGGIIEPFTAYNLIDEYEDYEAFSINT